MNPREKKLMIVVGVLVVFLGGWKIKQSYTAKLVKLDQEIERQANKLDEVQQEKAKANEAIISWMEFGQETLSTDKNDARIRLRDELNELSKRAGLKNINAEVSERGKLAGGSLLQGTVKAEGTLDQVLRFLYDVHRQPYMVRCTKLVLDPVDEDGSGRDRPGRRRGPTRLEMDVNLETPVLPDTTRVKNTRLKTADLKGKREFRNERLMLASAAEYENSIIDELFKPYAPPPPPPPPPPPDDKKKPTKPPKRPEPPPPPPPDRMMTVGRMLSWPGGRQVVLEQSGKPDKRVEVGEEMYGGTLIYIHPKGAVTQQEDGKRLFHPLGEKLLDSQPLTKDAYPEIYYHLAKLEQRAGGISRGPG